MELKLKLEQKQKRSIKHKWIRNQGFFLKDDALLKGVGCVLSNSLVWLWTLDCALWTLDCGLEFTEHQTGAPVGYL